MKNTDIVFLIDKFNKQFKYFKTLPNENDLQKIIELQNSKIEHSYKTISNNKISKNAFYSYWIYEELYKQFTQINTKKLHKQNKFNTLIKKFSYHLPIDILDELKKKIETGEKFDEIPNQKLQKIFQRIVIERNLFASKNNFQSQIEFSLYINKVNTKDFLNFKKNYLNSKLKNSNYQCEICKLKSFPFNNLIEAQNYAFSQLNKAKRYSNKIKILFDINNSIYYKKETDEFIIKINKNVNSRHQMLALIHEICHIEIFLKFLETNKNPIFIGKYITEKETLTIFSKLLKNLNTKIEDTYFNDLTLLTRDNIFEIEIYKNPTNFQKKYIEICNKLNIKITSPNIYLYNSDFLLRPFASLNHCIAIFNLKNS